MKDMQKVEFLVINGNSKQLTDKMNDLAKKYYPTVLSMCQHSEEIGMIVLQLHPIQTH